MVSSNAAQVSVHGLGGMDRAEGGKGARDRVDLDPWDSATILGRTAAAQHQMQPVAPRLVLGVLSHLVLDDSGSTYRQN